MRPEAVWLLGLAFLLGSCYEPAAPLPQKIGQEEAEPSLLFEGFMARGSQGGVKQWEAEARLARVYHVQDRAVAEDVNLRYFQSGRQVSEGSAKRAEIDLKRYDLKAEGSVQLKGQGGAELFTEHLEWDNARQEVRTSARVLVRRGGSVLRGRGLRADRKLDKVEVLEDVQIESDSIQRLRKLGKQE